jgi:hypothetical protein
MYQRRIALYTELACLRSISQVTGRLQAADLHCCIARRDHFTLAVDEAVAARIRGTPAI